MKRYSFTVDGFDCIYGVCRVKDCPGKKGRSGVGNHGISGEIWFYSVIADDMSVALSLEIHTDIYPDSIPASHWRGYAPDPDIFRHRWAFGLAFHRRTEGNGYQGCNAFGPSSGNYIRCVVDMLSDNEFWRTHGDPYQYIQPESFWSALEDKFEEMA